MGLFLSLISAARRLITTTLLANCFCIITLYWIIQAYVIWLSETHHCYFTVCRVSIGLARRHHCWSQNNNGACQWALLQVLFITKIVSFRAPQHLNIIRSSSITRFSKILQIIIQMCSLNHFYLYLYLCFVYFQWSMFYVLCFILV